MKINIFYEKKHDRARLAELRDGKNYTIDIFELSPLRARVVLMRIKNIIHKFKNGAILKDETDDVTIKAQKALEIYYNENKSVLDADFRKIHKTNKELCHIEQVINPGLIC